jgi:hypothetical protein
VGVAMRHGNTTHGNAGGGEYPPAEAFSYVYPYVTAEPQYIFSLGRLVVVKPEGLSSARGGDGVALELTRTRGGNWRIAAQVSPE